MNLKFNSTIQAFRSLMPKAYFLNRRDMDVKTIQVPCKGQDYTVHIWIKYVGINSLITAEVGKSHLTFDFPPHGGLEVKVTDEALDKELVREIEWAVMNSLEK